MQLFKGDITPRRYQETIFATAAGSNTLVVLPTGLGKTMIAIMLAAHRLKQYPNSKVLLLAPTKPLVQQHLSTFSEYLDITPEEMVLFTGSVKPEQRAQLWTTSRIVFSTPQTLENDVLSRRISLEDVSLVIFDECHRATGDYAYVFLAKQYEKQANRQRILGLSARPGTDEESITEVCNNLHIEEIEIRSIEDPDVEPYVQEMDIQWVKVRLPQEMQVIRKLLDQCLTSRVAHLRQHGYNERYVNKSKLLAMQRSLQGQISRGERDFETMKAISVVAEAMKIYHARELLDTQGIYALRKYLHKLQDQASKGQSKAVQNVVSDVTFKAARVKAETLEENTIEHPKLEALMKVVLKHRQPDVKIMIFTQYRDQAVRIERALLDINVSARVFVGQMKKGGTGMSQKEQKQMLDEFRSGEFSCLIATSVAEEGLDIPKVDLVIFYEPVPSAIRTVQRRGRTGRGEKGKVVVLMTEGTSDVGSKWSAHHKEKRMYRAIEKVKKDFKMKPNEKEQKTLLQKYYDEKKSKREDENKGLKIIGDYREKGSAVMKQLIDAGIHLDLQQLEVGDYHLSDRVVVEYKTVQDFVDSIVDGRLLSQLKSMRQYTRPIIIIEGEQDMYSLRRIHPNAIQGMLSTIVISYNIPIIQTRSPRETAQLLISMAKKEQVAGQEWQYHSSKPLSDKELQEYIVAAFPGIGSQLAKPLLKEFKSIKNIVNASEEELKKVSLIGDKKAKRIKDVAEGEYDSLSQSKSPDE